MKEQLRQWALDTGAEFCRFAKVDSVDSNAVAIYRDWLSKGRNGTMTYMERYDDVRNNPALLLEGAQTLMVCLFNYNPDAKRMPGAPRIADYALGSDYHDELRTRLSAVTAKMAETYGATSRICIDTAPLRERYWAARAGLGFIGKNNQLIVPTRGSAYFIATIITTLQVEPDAPCTHSGCGNCRACVDACPTHALIGDGSCDTSRCLSYLTIENRDELPADINLAGNLYGCDICRLACPYNRLSMPSNIEAFKPREAVLSLTLDDWLNMEPETFRTIFRKSAVKRAKLAHIQSIAQLKNKIEKNFDI
jgi:epoxyqueuosine reductase